MSYPYLQDAEFLKEIDTLQVKEQWTKITVLNFEEKPLEAIEGRVTNGQVSINGNSTLRRTANLTLLLNENEHSITSVRNLISINKKIKLETGFTNTTDRYTQFKTIWFPLGVYVITSVNISHSANGLSVTLQLQDKMCLLNGSVGGTIPASIVFDNYDEVGLDGQTYTVKPTIFMIIQELVNHYGNEQLSKIIISDIDLTAKQVMKWCGSSPVYVKGGTNINEPADVQVDISKVNNTYTTYPYGRDIGYIYTSFTYPGDLISNAGDSVCTILDKIKGVLGNYEYFYDLDGNFVFQEIKNYLNTTHASSAINELTQNDYAVDFKGKSVYTFDNNTLIVSCNNTPKYDMIKNDFVVWGIRTTSSNNTVPIRYHLAIDSKPVDTEGRGRDWRQILYEQGKEAETLGLDSNYYYSELKNEWPKLYNTTANQFYEDVLKAPSDIDFFLDFIDTDAEISELSVENIGRRSKVINDKSINCIFEPEIPNLVWLSLDDADLVEKRQECIAKGQPYCQVDANIYAAIVSGGSFNSAYNAVRDLLYQYTSYNESVALQAIPVYYLEPNTRITINDAEANIFGDYMIKSISFPLGISGTMAISCTRALEKM